MESLAQYLENEMRRHEEKINNLMKNIKITNICAMAEFNAQLNLYKLDKRFEHQKYDAKKFSANICKLNHVTLLIYYNGKIIITGAKTKQQIMDTIIIIEEILNTKLISYQITNICASLNINEELNLRKITKWNINASYEPEIYPGLKLKIDDYIFTVHHNGKTFTTGFKNIKTLNKTYKKMLSTILI